MIYAVQANAFPKNYYEINGALALQPIFCSNERDRYNEAQAALNNVKGQLAILEEALMRASASGKPAIALEITGIEKTKLVPAQAALNAAQNALNACLMQTGAA